MEDRKNRGGYFEFRNIVPTANFIVRKILRNSKKKNFRNRVPGHSDSAN